MKKFLALSFIVAIIFPSAVGAFSDVSESTTYKKAIDWMIQQDIVEDKGKFFPDRAVTKGELFEMAWRAAGYKPEQITQQTTPFDDISPTSRFAPYAKRASETGLAPTNGNFQPSARMNRADTLKIIFDVLGIGITRVFEKKDLPFSDVKINTKNAPIAKTALEFGIRADQKEFKPREKMSRGEAAHSIYTISTQTPSPTPNIQIIELRTSSSSDSTFTQHEKFKILVDVWDKIHEKYVGKEPIDDKKLLYGAINGMVNKLGDKYTVFQEPVAAKGFSESLTGEFDGIGISIDLIENKVKIISPIQGTPASKAGLKARDIILEVDKKIVDGLSLSEVSSMIKGQTGTQVELLIEREGKKITFVITRERIKLEAIVGEMKGKVAYIIIRNFSQSSGVEFAQQVKKLMAKNPTSFIIDLRDNPGGYLDASLQMLDVILPKETRLASLKFSQRDNAEEFFATQVSGFGRATIDPAHPEVIFHSIGDGELSKYPIKVLINGGSASASEIVAASLKENGVATLIGEKSFGKGTVQEITDYIDGSIYKQTIGKWQTPNEKNLTENPIEPDVAVKDNPKTEGDEILEYALKN